MHCHEPLDITSGELGQQDYLDQLLDHFVLSMQINSLNVFVIIAFRFRFLVDCILGIYAFVYQCLELCLVVLGDFEISTVDSEWNSNSFLFPH